MATMTFQAARAAILAHLASLPDWTVKASLKVPQAKCDNGHTLFFKAQAVYLDAHSLHVDIRTLSPVEFLAAVNRTIHVRQTF